jgi:hypothetical protein
MQASAAGPQSMVEVCTTSGASQHLLADEREAIIEV